MISSFLYIIRKDKNCEHLMFFCFSAFTRKQKTKSHVHCKKMLECWYFLSFCVLCLIPNLYRERRLWPLPERRIPLSSLSSRSLPAHSSPERFRKSQKREKDKKSLFFYQNVICPFCLLRKHKKQWKLEVLLCSCVLREDKSTKSHFHCKIIPAWP